jgi:uncharacterized membrane protein YtjA (UPF0391 family)
MFMSAVSCLLIAVLAAVCGYGGLPSAATASFARHVFLIAIGGFVVAALSVIAGLDEVAPTAADRVKAQQADGILMRGNVARLVRPDIKA